jgi:1-deoxy-D-xylulose-5-phosphate reductoisomerase
MRRVSILGATGSIGRQTLQVIACHPDKLSVVALAAGHDAERLGELVAQWRPKVAALWDEEAAKDSSWAC